MAFTTNEIVTRIVADNKKFDGVMDGSIRVMERFNKKGELIGSTVRVITNHMNDASKKTNSFRDAMVRLSRDIKVANTIFDTLKGGIKGAYEAASEGAKIMAAEQFFRNAGKSIEEYRKATNGMVSDAELMKKANLADSMGIDEKTFKKLVMVAEASALKTGQSFDYMFNSIIVGTARSSRLLLDNLGIIVSVKQANEAYAASIGKTVEQLTAEEKQLAFVNEVARKSQGTLDEYAMAADRTAESFARFDATMMNLVDTIKVHLAKAFSGFLPDLTDFFSKVKTTIENSDWAALGEFLGYRIIAGLQYALAASTMGGDDNPVKTWFEDAAKRSMGLADLAVTRSKFRKQDEKDELEDQLQALFRAASPNMDMMTNLAGREGKLQFFANFTKMQIDQLRAVDPHWAGLIEAIQETARALGDLPKAISTAAGLPDSPDKKEGRWDGTILRLRVAELDAEDKALAAVKEQRRKDQESKAKDANQRWMDDMDVIRRKIKERTEADLKGIYARAEEERKLQEAAIEAAKKAREEWDRMLNDLVANVTSGVASGTSLFGAAGASLGPMIGMAVGGPFGAALGALVPILGSLMDRLSPVVSFLGYVAKGLEALVGNALGPLLEVLRPLGPAFAVLLGAVGQLIGAIVAPLAAVLRVLATGLAFVIGVLAFWITFASAVMQLMTAVGQMLVFINNTQMGFAFEQLTTHLENAANGIDGFIFAMIEGVANFNNAIVKWVRSSIPGMKKWGKLMFAAQFGLGGESGTSPIDENTGAINENTRALRDFAREFRNLPANYKAFGAVYDAADPQLEWRGPRRMTGIGRRSVDGLQNTRWRT